MTRKIRGLGKGIEDLGLHELLAGMGEPVALAHRESLNSDKKGLQQIPLNRLQPGVYQPRNSMDDEGLLELAQSIRSHGIIQPVLVRAVSDDFYEIVAGERRWRAAKLANLQNIPVIIKDMTEESAAAVALIENIQRENLNVVDEARGLEKLIKQFSLTHQDLAKAVGKSRAAITNSLRILEADESVHFALEKKELSMGHARALLSLSKLDQAEMAKQILVKGLSVRSTESLVAMRLRPKKYSKSRSSLVEHEQLSKDLKTMVEIFTKNNGSGQIKVSFTSQEHLESILKLLAK